MFGLVADDVLNLKADETLSPFFEKRGLDQFQYEKNGKVIKMSFYMAPEDIFDNREEAKIWAAQSYEAAGPSKKRVKETKKKIGVS